MYYLCLAVSAAWLIYFAYLLTLDRQIRDIRRRLDARIKDA
ncbi:MAG: CcmD family protein [Planctomycetota bacterium]|jgi:CcmD family protein